MFLVFFQIMFLISRRGFRVHRKVSYLALVFLLYALISLTYRSLAGQKIGDFSLHVLVISNFFFLLLLFTDSAWRGTFIVAIYIAGTAHFMSLLPDPMGFRANLIAATAYDLGEGGLSELFRRETGLFPAPGMLAAFSIVLFVTSVLDFLRLRSKLWAILAIAMAIALGLATFNRSFFFAMPLSSLVLIWSSGVRSKALLLSALIIFAIIVLPLEEYIAFVGNRVVTLLLDGLDSTQRWTGSTGIVTGFRVFLDHPFFGSPVAPNGGTLQALDGEHQLVNPHNGWIQILATYGLIGGAPILALYGLSFMRVTHILLNRQYYRHELFWVKNLSDSHMFFATISISLAMFLMVEPLAEYSFIFVLSISPLLISLPSHSARSKV